MLELARRRTVVDLSWIRLRPWRELLAGLFEPAAPPPWLQAVERVEVTGKIGPRHLLGGWLMAQLRLLPSQVRLIDARHVEIRARLPAGGRAGHLRGRAGRARSRTVSARADDPGRPGVGPAGAESLQPIPLADDPLATSLAEALTHLQPDVIWEQALSAATTLGV